MKFHVVIYTFESEHSTQRREWCVVGSVWSWSLGVGQGGKWQEGKELISQFNEAMFIGGPHQKCVPVTVLQGRSFVLHDLHCNPNYP